MKEIVAKSYGKINLSLDILYKRDDNYHEIKSVMQSIDLHDRLIFREQESGITIDSNNPDVPLDSQNLVYKAWQALKPFSEEEKGINIYIEKNIPIAAGLAGGSSNSAITLQVLNKLWKLNLSQGELREIGSKIGADIPFCIMEGTALAEGIGDKLTPLKPFVDKDILICNPGIQVPTSYAYSLVDTEEERFDLRDMLSAIERDDIAEVGKALKNKMEKPIIDKYPIIQRIKDIMDSSGSLGSLMTGSGPTVFGIFGDRKNMETAYNELLKLTDQVYMTRTI